MWNLSDPAHLPPADSYPPWPQPVQYVRHLICEFIRQEVTPVEGVSINGTRHIGFPHARHVEQAAYDAPLSHTSCVGQATRGPLSRVRAIVLEGRWSRSPGFILSAPVMHAGLEEFAETVVPRLRNAVWCVMSTSVLRSAST